MHAELKQTAREVVAQSEVVVHEVRHCAPFPGHDQGAQVEFAPAVRNASEGQVAVVPVHCSATSQGPAEARQTVVDAESWLPGHAGAEPEQYSAGSQSP